MESQTRAVTEGFFTLAALLGLLLCGNKMWGAGQHCKTDFTAVAAVMGFASFVQHFVIAGGHPTQNVTTQRRQPWLGFHQRLLTVYPKVLSIAKICFTPRTLSSLSSPRWALLVFSNTRMFSCETLKTAVIHAGPGQLFCSPVAGGGTLLQKVRTLSLGVYHGTWSSRTWRSCQFADITARHVPVRKPPQ